MVGVAEFPVVHGGVHLFGSRRSLLYIHLDAQVHHRRPLRRLDVLHAVSFFRWQGNPGRPEVVDVAAHCEGFPRAQAVGVISFHGIARQIRNLRCGRYTHGHTFNLAPHASTIVSEAVEDQER